MVHMCFSELTKAHQVSLRVVTFGTEHKLLNEHIQHVLKFGTLVRPVDNEATYFRVHLGLGSQLNTKVLARVCVRCVLT